MVRPLDNITWWTNACRRRVRASIDTIAGNWVDAPRAQRAATLLLVGALVGTFLVGSGIVRLGGHREAATPSLTAARRAPLTTGATVATLPTTTLLLDPPPPPVPVAPVAPRVRSATTMARPAETTTVPSPTTTEATATIVAGPAPATATTLAPIAVVGAPTTVTAVAPSTTTTLATTPPTPPSTVTSTVPLPDRRGPGSRGPGRGGDGGRGRGSGNDD